MRQALIRLANDVPGLRHILVPMLREAEGPAFYEAARKLAMAHPASRAILVPLLKVAKEQAPLEKQKFRHPDSGNMVQFTSLPNEMQKKIRQRGKGKGESESKGQTSSPGQAVQQNRAKLEEELSSKWKDLNEQIGAMSKGQSRAQTVRKVTQVLGPALAAAGVVATGPIGAAVAIAAATGFLSIMGGGLAGKKMEKDHKKEKGKAEKEQADVSKKLQEIRKEKDKERDQEIKGKSKEEAAVLRKKWQDEDTKREQDLHKKWEAKREKKAAADAKTQMMKILTSLTEKDIENAKKFLTDGKLDMKKLEAELG